MCYHLQKMYAEAIKLSLGAVIIVGSSPRLAIKTSNMLQCSDDIYFIFFFGC